MNMEKKIVREKQIKIRKSILDKNEKSIRIVNQIINHPKYIGAKVIACYCSLKDEVNLDALILDAILKGKTVVVPKVKGNTMDFYEINHMNDLEIKTFGIREPINEVVFDKNRIDVMFVPGVAFDGKGNRMGFGRGYYDRYLGNLSLYKIGICFQEQMCDSIPVDGYDVRMDEIIVD